MLLNVALYKGMEVTRVDKERTIQFMANMAEDGPTSVKLKVKLDDLAPLYSNVMALLPSS